MTWSHNRLFKPKTKTLELLQTRCKQIVDSIFDEELKQSVLIETNRQSRKLPKNVTPLILYIPKHNINLWKDAHSKPQLKKIPHGVWSNAS